MDLPGVRYQKEVRNKSTGNILTTNNVLDYEHPLAPPKLWLKGEEMSYSILVRSGLGLTLLVLMATLASPAAASPGFAPLLDNGGFLTNCTGSYYNNMTLAGSPVLVRTDPILNFFWPENTSPLPAMSTRASTAWAGLAVSMSS